MMNTTRKENLISKLCRYNIDDEIVMIVNREAIFDEFVWAQRTGFFRLENSERDNERKLAFSVFKH